MKSNVRFRRGPELTDSLACMIDRLRTRAEDPSRPGARRAVLKSTDDFLDRLAAHVAGEGDRESHATLHAAARRLAVRILKGDPVVDSARVLLVQLLQHLRREDAPSPGNIHAPR